MQNRSSPTRAKDAVLQRAADSYPHDRIVYGSSRLGPLLPNGDSYATSGYNSTVPQNGRRGYEADRSFRENERVYTASGSSSLNSSMQRGQGKKNKGPYANVAREIESKLQFKSLAQVNEQRRRLSASDASLYQRANSYKNTQALLEQQLRFKPLAEVQEQRRRLSRAEFVEDLYRPQQGQRNASPYRQNQQNTSSSRSYQSPQRDSSYQSSQRNASPQYNYTYQQSAQQHRSPQKHSPQRHSPERHSPNRNQVVSLHEAKRELERQLRFRPKGEVEEMRRRYSRSDIQSYTQQPKRQQHQQRPPSNHAQRQLEQNLRFKPYYEVEEQRRRLSKSSIPGVNTPQRNQQQNRSPRTQREVARNLETNLQFRPLAEVQTLRRRLSSTPLPEDAQYDWTIRRDVITDQYVYESLPRPQTKSQGRQVQSQQRNGVPTNAKRELESRLEFKPYFEVQEMRRRLSRSDFNNTSPSPSRKPDVRNQLETQLKFKPLAEVQEQRRRLSKSNLIYYDSPYRVSGNIQSNSSKLESSLVFRSQPEVVERYQRLSIGVIEADNRERERRLAEIRGNLERDVLNSSFQSRGDGNRQGSRP
eukprot:TRINITY_DN735_c0_g1_i5.p1 TRINITY_DN735_c0_g1~~TRINITY_DN735_c0_g1_i5.p1  ORF type:complete len:588 (-),score=155.14 TRINITY_DN735_c0_g1_i5:132-1895(-)